MWSKLMRRWLRLGGPRRTSGRLWPFTLQVEPLGERIVPAIKATFSAAQGVLTVIGDVGDNTIVVSDPSISTHHAQLLLEGDTYRLKDLDSTNGTRVNGKPVTEAVLKPDDRIRFGAAEARYESSEAGGSKPLPKPEEIKAHFGEAGAGLPQLSGASPLRRQEQQNDPVRTGIFIGLGLVLVGIGYLYQRLLFPQRRPDLLPSAASAGG